MDVGRHKDIDGRGMFLRIAGDPLPRPQAVIGPRRRDEIADAGRGAGIDQEAGAVGTDNQCGIAAAGVDVMDIEFAGLAHGQGGANGRARIALAGVRYGRNA